MEEKLNKNTDAVYDVDERKYSIIYHTLSH